MKGMLLAGINRMGTVAALLAGTASSVAYAQDKAAASDSSIGAAASIPDIIVTASRFSETIQRSSNIISVINPDKLVGITDVRQLQTVDPGVQLGVSGGITNVFVRGVGSFNVQNNQSASVSFNVDGVSLYTSTMITPSMYDIERIEVLKGPQGTLYGRNASGGVVNVITNGAKLGAVEGYVEGEFGNYDQRRLTGALNLPLGETLAVRLAAQHTEHDGYLSDGSDDQDQTTVGSASAGSRRALSRSRSAPMSRGSVQLDQARHPIPTRPTTSSSGCATHGLRGRPSACLRCLLMPPRFTTATNGACTPNWKPISASRR